MDADSMISRSNTTLGAPDFFAMTRLMFEAYVSQKAQSYVMAIFDETLSRFAVDESYLTAKVTETVDVTVFSMLDVS